MPLPPLNDDGLLPEGLHEATLDELNERFGRMLKGSSRARLSADLGRYLEALDATGLVDAVILDGSFVTSEDAPNDIDLIAVLARGNEFGSDLQPAAYNLLATRQVRKRFGLDVFAFTDGTASLREMTQFFEQVRGRPHLKKGLVRIRL